MGLAVKNILQCSVTCSILLAFIPPAYAHTIPLYPTPEFTHVEKICKELWRDLDVLMFDHTLQKEWIEQSDYLFNQFVLLHCSVKNLINDREQSPYLLEDIYYLQEIFDHLKNRYNTITPIIQSSIIESIAELLDQAQENLKVLLLLNQEVILM